MTTALELYEALKSTVGEEAARMIAEALPMTDRVATKSDLAALETRVDARFERFEARIFRWMLGFFGTLWVAQGALIAAILAKL